MGGLVAIAVSGWPVEGKEGFRRRIGDAVAGYSCSKGSFPVSRGGVCGGGTTGVGWLGLRKEEWVHGWA